MTPERLGLLWGVTVFAGASARLVAALSGLPGVVLLLLSGLLIGRSGLGLVEPLDLGQGLATVVGLLVSLVLFDGGLNLRLPGDTIKATVLRISVVRLLLSLGSALLAAHWLAGLNWSVAAVYSAIVLATDHDARRDGSGKPRFRQQPFAEAEHQKQHAEGDLKPQTDRRIGTQTSQSFGQQPSSRQADENTPPESSQQSIGQLPPAVEVAKNKLQQQQG